MLTTPTIQYWPSSAMQYVMKLIILCTIAVITQEKKSKTLKKLEKIQTSHSIVVSLLIRKNSVSENWSAISILSYLRKNSSCCDESLLIYFTGNLITTALILKCIKTDKCILIIISQQNSGHCNFWECVMTCNWGGYRRKKIKTA